MTAHPPRLLPRLLALFTVLALALVATPAVADDAPESPASTATLAWDGDLRVGSVLRPLLDGAEPPAGTTFRWLADGVATGIEDPTLVVTEEHAGLALSVELGPDHPVVSAPTPRLLRSAVPSLVGVAVEGGRLTVDAGSWSPGTTHAYEWFADGTPLDHRGLSLTLGAAHRDRAISVSLRGSLAGHGSVTEVSAPSARVQRAAVPSIRGTLVGGSTLTASPGTWGPGTSLTYRWYADGRAVSGVATKRTFRISSALAGRRLQVRVTGTRDDRPVTRSSATTAVKVVGSAPTPRIGGARAVGRTLTLTRGTWPRGTTTRYRWYADGKAVSGATRSTFRVPSGAAGKRITVSVTGTRPGYATVTRTSTPTARVQRIGKATLSGSTLAGRRVSVSPGSWTSGTRFTYTWTLDGKRIAGATRSSIQVKSSWAGKRLRATVRGTKTGYSPFSSTTSPSSPVRRPAPAPRPTRTDPVSAWNCPSWAPIKGNADSGIYHLRHQRYYDRTKPEECFATEAAAVRAGYRRAKV